MLSIFLNGQEVGESLTAAAAALSAGGGGARFSHSLLLPLPRHVHQRREERREKRWKAGEEYGRVQLNGKKDDDDDDDVEDDV